MSWKITSNAQDQSQLLVDESLFSQGNGYLGVRGNFEEGYAKDMKSIRGTYINAFHDIVPIEYGEKLFGFPDTQQKLVNVMDTQSIQVSLDGEVFSLFTGDVLDYKRLLHMDKGYAERTVHWRSPGGKEAEITFNRLISFVHKELFVQWIEIKPLSEIEEIHVESSINGGVTNYVDADDPRVASGHAKRLHVTDVFTEGDVSGVVDETEVSQLQAAAAVTLRAAGSVIDRGSSSDAESVRETLRFSGDQPIMVEKWTVFTDTYRHGDEVKHEAITRLKGLSETSIEHILTGQQSYLDEFWKTADIQISGDDLLQEGIRFNLYQLLQSVGKDPKSNIAAKGLSGEGYEGHYFWDTEIYMYPPFLMTDPAIAKNLLLHRFSLLDAAKDRAKEMGHRQGALFPWRTITGGECSAFFPAGSAQYHISADIAYSFIHYYLTTGDRSFMISHGAELLVETARLWIDAGHMKDDQFRIDDVTGPDEYTCIVNNNYYTNSMAKYNLEWAVKAMAIVKEDDPSSYESLVRKLGLEGQELDQFQAAAMKMYYPYDDTLGIQAQDDTFLNKQVWDLEKTPKEEFPLLLHYHPLTLYRYQVCKQADTVLSYFLLEDEADEETIRRSYDYYEKVTTHDSSLSYCVFSIMAAKLGYENKAYHYFIETARLDLDNTHKNTKDGLHMANMGGTWLALVSGFGGMRVKETGLHFAPRLPKEWDELRFHIRYHDRLIAIDMTTNQTEYTLLEGEPLHFFHHGEELELVSTAIKH
ncbi:glycoside hydrolase family 65 protein [Salisediminibacterium beveridgei]|uniref:Maltose phosphorylase / Trehalose phosphorylase n=1 Tax=Salisediminibacterium beveridgei TaxID=632773 RepID=A0A1D7QSW5_9BACI|nr:glycosyl hydrolase family 65 protein [Salisediminibacterium beveridgei]AOM82077.1 Maltose phosphorylase / Trehalose phosphorylase [Salisediminibacterium beveridgei]